MSEPLVGYSNNPSGSYLKKEPLIGENAAEAGVRQGLKGQCHEIIKTRYRYLKV